MTHRYAAIDLGASSGRVVVGTVGDGVLALEEVHRFWNGPVRLPDGYRWDVLHLWREVLQGLRKAAAGGPVVSIGIDSWAIDHGFLDADGCLLGNPWHHRDDRTDGYSQVLAASLSAEQLYGINGLQHLPFTTVYQLMASQSSASWSTVDQMLLVPDLFTYWLTGVRGSERTNASTTGLLDVRTGEWSTTLLEAVGVPKALFAPLRDPGDIVGPLLPSVQRETGIGPEAAVTTVGSHDTASAVVGVPAISRSSAYVACGTWALAGVELAAPILTEESRAANFTNERGVDSTFRYLSNVMGLWVLSETLRSWANEGRPVILEDVLGRAAALPGGRAVDIDDSTLLSPGDMPYRLEQLCLRSGQPVPESQAAMVRLIVESLAAAFARNVHQAARLAGKQVDVIHIVGGGSRNELLCRLTAEAAGLPVVAGPAEATALGNVLVQARAHGDIHGTLDDLRALVRRSHNLLRYDPS